MDRKLQINNYLTKLIYEFKEKYYNDLSEYLLNFHESSGFRNNCRNRFCS